MALVPVGLNSVCAWFGLGWVRLGLGLGQVCDWVWFVLAWVRFVIGCGLVWVRLGLHWFGLGSVLVVGSGLVWAGFGLRLGFVWFGLGSVCDCVRFGLG